MNDEQQTGIDHVNIYSASWLGVILILVGQSERILVGKLFPSADAGQAPWCVIPERRVK